MVETVFYLRDTGYQDTALTGERDEWLVNQGEPIRLHITDVQIDSQANAVISSQVDDIYYTPTIISREMPILNVKCYIIQDFAVNGFVYIYNKNSGSYDPIENPPVSAVIALFEQMVGKTSHFDLYMSDGSGVTPDYFFHNPLYWIARVKTNTSDNLTPETHLNVKLLSYTLTKATNKKYDINLRFVVLP